MGGFQTHWVFYYNGQSYNSSEDLLIVKEVHEWNFWNSEMYIGRTVWDNAFKDWVPGIACIVLCALIIH